MHNSKLFVFQCSSSRFYGMMMNQVDALNLDEGSHAIKAIGSEQKERNVSYSTKENYALPRQPVSSAE